MDRNSARCRVLQPGVHGWIAPTECRASVVLVTFNVAIGIWSNVAFELTLVTINVSCLTHPSDGHPASFEPAALDRPHVSD